MTLLIDRTKKREALIQSMMSLSMTRTQAELAADRILKKEVFAEPEPVPEPEPEPAPEPEPEPEPAQERPDDLLTPIQVAAMTGQAVSNLANRRFRNAPPAFEKHRGKIFYRRSDVEAYVESLSFGMLDGDRVLYPTEAAHLLGVSLTALANWRTSGKGPRFRKGGKNKSTYIYLESEVKAFARARKEQEVSLLSPGKKRSDPQDSLQVTKESILAQIHDRIVELGMSRRDVAKTVFSAYARNSHLSIEWQVVTRDPTVGVLAKYAEALGCTLEFKLVPKKGGS